MHRTAQGGLAIWLVGIVAVLAGCSDDPAPEPDRQNPFTYDRNQPLDPKRGEKDKRGEVDVEKVSFAAVDRERVPALFAVPRDRRGAGPCLVYQGGIGSRKEDASFLWAGLARGDVATFTIDTRDAGARQEGPDDLDRMLKDPKAAARSLRGTVIDLRRAVDYLASRKECDPDRIGFAGVSYGALLGTLLAGSDKRVRATVLFVAGGGWPEILRSSKLILPGIAKDDARLSAALEVLRPYEPLKWIARISPRPVLLVNGRRDETTPFSLARRLQAAAREPKEVMIYPGGHDPFRGAHAEEVVTKVGDFLDAELVHPDRP